MRVVKNIAKILRIEDYEKLDSIVLTEEIADVLFDDESEVYARTRTELLRILLKYGVRIHNSDTEFEKQLKKLKEKFEREQRIILKAYETELNEYFSDPTTYSLF